MAVGKFDRRSRDQKRKAKLKRRSSRSQKHESLAYRGNKYRKEEFVEIMFSTETGILESDVMSDRTLTDDVVEAAIEGLILRMRRETTHPPGASSREVDGAGPPADLIVWNIERNWELYA